MVKVRTKEGQKKERERDGAIQEAHMPESGSSDSCLEL